MPDITSRPSHLLLSYPCLQRRLIAAILDKTLHWLHPKFLQKNAFQLIDNMLKIWHTSFSFLRVQSNIGHSIAAKLGKHVRIIAENRFPSVDYSTVASGQPWLQKKKPSTTLSPTFCSILALHFVQDDHYMEHASHKLLQRLLSIGWSPMSIQPSPISGHISPQEQEPHYQKIAWLNTLELHNAATHRPTRILPVAVSSGNIGQVEPYPQCFEATKSENLWEEDDEAHRSQSNITDDKVRVPQFLVLQTSCFPGRTRNCYNSPTHRRSSCCWPSPHS